MVRNGSTKGRKEDRRVALFLVDAASFIPSSDSSSIGSACLHSLHCLRSTAKGFPNTPHPGRRLLVCSLNISPPTSSKIPRDENRLMLERDPRRSRAGGRRRSSRSREFRRYVCACTRTCALTLLLYAPLVDYRRTAILTLVISPLMYVCLYKAARCLKNPRKWMATPDQYNRRTLQKLNYGVRSPVSREDFFLRFSRSILCTSRHISYLINKISTRADMSEKSKEQNPARIHTVRTALIRVWYVTIRRYKIRRKTFCIKGSKETGSYSLLRV